jgi:hypothetical protein
LAKTAVAVGLLCLTLAPMTAAEMEWQSLDDIATGCKPVDMTISADGETAIILCEQEVLFVDATQRAVRDRIPLEAAYTRVTVAKDGGTLFLSHPSRQKVSVLKIERIYDLAPGGSPIIGSPAAGIDLVAFLDFQ